MQTIFTISAYSLSFSLPFQTFLNDSTVRPVSTSIVHKPKQMATESQITLSCEVDGSVPDTEIKWTQNNRVFERGNVSLSFDIIKVSFLFTFVLYSISRFPGKRGMSRDSEKLPFNLYYTRYTRNPKAIIIFLI